MMKINTKIHFGKGFALAYFFALIQFIIIVTVVLSISSNKSGALGYVVIVFLFYIAPIYSVALVVIVRLINWVEPNYIISFVSNWMKLLWFLVIGVVFFFIGFEFFTDSKQAFLLYLSGFCYQLIVLFLFLKLTLKIQN